jgi:IPT/TIG domain-containing protein
MARLNLTAQYNGRTSKIKAPTIVSIAPISAPAAGGDAITITGTNFQPGTKFTLGGVEVTSIVIVSKTSATAVTGAHAAGVVDGIATKHDGRALVGPTAVGVFEYT